MVVSDVTNNNNERGIKRKKKFLRTNKKIKKFSDNKIDESIIVPPVRNSNEPALKKVNWINKTRVLIFSSRGISYRERHLMEDLRRLMPHSKPEVKNNNKKRLEDINEMAEMKNCSKVLYFEPKKQKDLYLWMTDVSRGLSVKFLVQNIHTMNELRMSGNCLKGSRPLLSFDKNFQEPHWMLIKEHLIQIFGTPKGHPKSQPFFDNIYTFSLLEGKIWFRNYQIVEEDDGQLTEIGPRFVLNPIKIFNGSFRGATLWSNPNYISPNSIRSQLKEAKSAKYVNAVAQRENRAKRAEGQCFVGDPTAEFFQTEPADQLVQKKSPKNKRKKINK